ncbi:MAG: vitamin B12 dependent-methionine synthase activation domain-containing protein [Bacteroidales bacterium]
MPVVLRCNFLYRSEIGPGDIRISKDEVRRLLGYEDQSIDPHLDEITDDFISKAYPLLDPQAGFILRRITEFDRKTGTIRLDDVVFDLGKIIMSQLRNTEFVALFQCTIGKKVELFSEELFSKGDNLEGYIVNLAGSEAAESAAGFVHREIRKLAEENNLKITNRFSPGYCNWNVKEQFRLFSLFPEGSFGITLTQSALMDPVKSVSGLVGVGEQAKFLAYNCSRCDDEYCIYRRGSKK